MHEGDCYIGQPFSGYALRGDSKDDGIIKDDDIIMIGAYIKKQAFFREYLPALSMDADMFRFFLDPQTDKFSDEFIHLSFEKTSPVRRLLELMVIEYVDRQKRRYSVRYQTDGSDAVYAYCAAIPLGKDKSAACDADLQNTDKCPIALR